ncbi:MAG: 50S ribosomal protein L29 [Candidatus Margulisbacteria bacterium]|nr:50S ribosomal protein L29 [Candidatus Margulisiibacteriota bacterium]
MKTKELREMTADELNKKAGELQRELLSTRIQHAGQQLKNPLKLRELRHDIARVLTIINEKSAGKATEVK